jgi:hypothetical protein
MVWKKSLHFVPALLLFSINAHAVSYFENDFRDTNSSYHLHLRGDAKSNGLPFNIFEKEWKNIPPHKQENHAFGNLYYEFYFKMDDLKIGIFKQDIAQIYFNEGFFQTWYTAQKDFFALLLNPAINTQLSSLPIKGEGNYYTAQGVYLQKVFELSNTHFLSTKLKLNHANEFQNIQVDGYTNSEKFKGSFDYYYGKKNYISNAQDKDESLGLGYSLDIEYLYNKQNLYFYLGAFNLYSFIYWENVTHMHYDLDSQVIYEGDDGYNHYKPFGVGYYEYNVKYTQRLPAYYKASLNYELSSSLACGNNLDFFDGTFFNEPYLNAKIGAGRYKFGYGYENQEIVFATYFQHFSLELSNQLGFQNNILKASCKIAF